MVLGIGNDILDIDRIRNAFDSDMDSFFKATYTDAERQQARQRPDPVAYFATRFAGKEAVFKCLGIDPAKVRLDQIEILGSQTGQPQVTLSGELKALAEKKGFRRIHISLSFESKYALAFALGQD